MKKTLIIDLICGAFILLFVYAATSKLMDMHKFAAQIGQSPIFTSVSHLVAWMVIVMEFGASMLLAWPRHRIIGLHASLFLMTIFTTYILVILSFSENIPCSGGGVLQRLGWGEHLAFNIFFVALAIAGIVLQQRIPKYASHATS